MSALLGASATLRGGAVPAPHLPRLRYELSCGATLLVSPRAGAPVVAAQIHVRGGHSLDPPGLEGTAALTGSLADQGTACHTEEELATMLEPAGGTVHGDSSGLSGSIEGRSWKLLLDLLGELVTEPSYPRAKVERQKQRLVDRLLVEHDDPRTQAANRFRRLVYGEHWLGRPLYGSLESVPRIERRHLLAHHRKHWCARRALIAVCGDVDPETVRRFVDRRLRDWKPGTQAPPFEEKFPARAPRVDAFPAQRQQVHVYLGHLGVRRADPDYPALVVLDHVLGTGPGFTNRLSRRLRDELGLAYTVYANIHSSAGLLPGTFTAYIGTSPRHVGTAVRTFLAEMQRIRDEPIDEAELELAQSYLVGSYALGFERAARRVSYLVTSERFGLPDDHLEQLPGLFSAVTRDDLVRVARKHLHPKDACLAASGPIDRATLAKLVRAPGPAKRSRKARKAAGPR